MTISYELTKDDYIEFNMHYSKSNKKTISMYKVYMIIIAVAILLPTLRRAFNSERIEYFPLVLGLIVLWFAFFARSKWIIKNRCEKILKSGRNPGLIGEKVIVFKEEHLICKDDYSYTEIKWNGFEKLEESNTLILLFITVNQAIIIPKRLFLLPQEEYDIKSFIERKLAEQKNIS